jgi:hypothetical protein
MSFVVAAPDAIATAAENAAGIGSSLRAASAAAAAPTTGLLAAASAGGNARLVDMGSYTPSIFGSAATAATATSATPASVASAACLAPPA